MLSVKMYLPKKTRLEQQSSTKSIPVSAARQHRRSDSSSRKCPANRQVICVTHLAQVAVFADHHLLIHKQEQNGRTYTTIDFLDESQRVKEIARMISGDNLTDTAIKNAEEMLALAAGEEQEQKKAD